MAYPNFLLNSRALIIGGSSGLGFAVASGALANGSRLQSLYSGAHVSGSAADLSSAETLATNLQAVLDAAVKETGGPLDHIVYTAGDILPTTPLAEMTATAALAPFTVRFLGPLLLAKHVAANPGKYLNVAASSSITLTSGIIAHRPPKGMVGIGSAGAVEVLIRALAVELAPIRVNVIIPGAVYTEMVDKMLVGIPNLLDIFKAGSLTKEVGTPEGAAEAYLFCMRSALATGQCFTIDNGRWLV